MKIEKHVSATRVIKSVILFSAIIGPYAFASDSYVEETRLYIGSCPSQPGPLPSDNNKVAVAAVSAITAIGGKLVEVGINALGNALVKAGSPDSKSSYAAANFSSLTRMSECLTIIDGRFSFKPNDNAEIYKLTSDMTFASQRENIRKNLTDNQVYLAAVPNKYVELRVFVPQKVEDGPPDNDFFLTPITLAFNKPVQRNAFGFYTGKRDIVISAALNSMSTTTALANLLTFKQLSTPTFFYYDPKTSINCNYSPKSSTGFIPLCGGEQVSQWVKYPAGKGPYRLEVGVTEARNGSAFVKAVGDAIVANKDKLAAEANNKIFDDYRDAAAQAKTEADQTAMKAQDKLVVDAFSAFTTARNSLKACEAIDPTKIVDAQLALVKYQLDRRLAATAFLIAGNPSEIPMDTLPKDKTVCP